MFCIVVLLIVGCFSRGAWSCSCAPKHPQTAYCHSEIVFRGKFIGQTPHNSIRDGWVQYEMNTTKVYKCPDQIKDLQFVYSPGMESLCGYQHQSTNKSQEFLITASIVNEQVMITSCGYITPWATLTAFQKRGFQQVYQNGCSCQIVPCYSVPCEVTSDRQCLWTDSVMQRTHQNKEGPQALHLACVNKGNGLCTWESQKSRLLTTINKSTAH